MVHLLAPHSFSGSIGECKVAFQKISLENLYKPYKIVFSSIKTIAYELHLQDFKFANVPKPLSLLAESLRFLN